MAIKQDWNNSHLEDYLLYGNWQPYQAWCVLAGFDYHANKELGKFSFDENHALDISAFIPFDFDFREAEIKIKTMNDNVDRLRNFWISDDKNDEAYAPSYFIDWALSKRFRPDWLDWAIEKKLYIPSVEAETETQKNIFDKSSATYPPELDLAMQAWQSVANSKGKGKPKARIKNWLDINAKGLSNEAKERISIVANWDKLGGATRTD